MPAVPVLPPLTLLAVLVLSSAAVAAPPNTMTITDKSGVASANYPLQFGRAFVAGEIAGYPQLVINGAPVPTQADVKNRHPDGSVKFAVIAAVVPIPASGSLSVSFANQASGNNVPLTQTQMLDPKYAEAAIQFDATAISAQTMLSAGKCSPWTQGQIAQTMVCADDSLAHAYDVGPIRPRFHLTFWPDRLAVRYVVENSLAGAMIDKQYAVSLTLGDATVYSKPALIHPFGSRWTKVAWQGAPPQPKVNIDYNLGYLGATYAVPNINPAPTVPEATIAGSYTAWLAKPRDLYQYGLWNQYMPTTGGRPDIGMMPGWYAEWLVSGDWRLREIALGQANLATAWTMHFREGRAGKKINKAQTVDGVGLPLSVYAEPNLYFPTNNGLYGQGIALSDGHTIVTDPAIYPPTAYGWVADAAHQPSPFLIPYLLTGDPYYMEGAQFWASAAALHVPPGTCAWGEGSSPCRGPGAGIGDGETRAVAWVVNNRMAAAAVTPDDQVTLKGFFTDMIDDAAALFEGRAGITGTRFQGTPEWTYGQTVGVKLGTNPLRAEQCIVLEGACSTSQWMQYYLISSLGWAAERGYPVNEYRKYLGALLTGQFAEAGYNKFNLGSYWVWFKTPAGTWYPTWTELQTANVAGGKMSMTASWPNPGDLTYGVYAKAAASYTIDLPNGQAAYDWLRANLVIDPVAYGLQWNLVPTGAVAPPIPPVKPAATASLAASPVSIESGASSTLTYSSTNATSCAGVGFTPIGLSGSVAVQPAATATFSLTCTGPGGASPPATATVTVSTAPPQPPGIAIGSHVRTIRTTNVHKTWNGKVLCIQPPGATGVVVDGPTGGTGMWKVNFVSLCDGFVSPTSVVLAE